MIRARYWRLMPLIVFIALACFFWRGLSLEPQKLPSAQLGKPMPRFQLPSLNAPSEIIRSDQLRGRLFLLNVWASWCSACTEEQVFLMQLAREGISMIGLNYKDKPAHARQWLETWGNPYQAIAQDSDGKAAIDLGVYGAPETFLVSASGVIQYRHAGVLTDEIWQTEFLPRIRSLQDGGLK